MPYVVTDDCTKDMLCVDRCAMGAIHPTQDEPEFETAKQLYINPDQCFECGACAAACVCGAILLADELPPEKQHSVAENAAFNESMKR